MSKEKFLLVSLKEDQAKHLAQVISNDTCRQILDYLADKDATETSISKDLGIPLSTVHYNIQQLVKGNLVVTDEYHYSQKGKEVAHYRLANKYIIIAPQSVYGLKEKLKSLLPVALLGLGIAFIIRYFTRSLSSAAPMMESSIAQGASAKSLANAAPMMAPSSGAGEGFSQAFYQGMPVELWFFAGVIFALIVYLLIDFFSSRKK